MPVNAIVAKELRLQGTHRFHAEFREAAEAITYSDLHQRVCRMANVLKGQGIGKGDRVCIYLPMIPELAVAVLACARIGAVHSVVFAGFSATALATRINDCDCHLVLTSDGSYRGAKTIDLKGIVDTALEDCPGVRSVLVARRIGSEIRMQDGRVISDEPQPPAEG